MLNDKENRGKLILYVMELWNDMHFVKTEKSEDYIPKFMGLTVCETPKITRSNAK